VGMLTRAGLPRCRDSSKGNYTEQISRTWSSGQRNRRAELTEEVVLNKFI